MVSNRFFVGFVRIQKERGYTAVTGGLYRFLRTVLEDRTLWGQLASCADYARRVRYRLLPGVW